MHLRREDGLALTDALRLSRGMSYKNAMAGLPLGGGKSVILADRDRTKTPEMLLTDILKDDWGFRGFVSSDFNACPGYTAFNKGVDVCAPDLHDTLRRLLQVQPRQPLPVPRAPPLGLRRFDHAQPQQVR